MHAVFNTGNFEVGVHIADVTYFVEEGSALDVIASQRATSVYLVQKVRAHYDFYWWCTAQFRNNRFWAVQPWPPLVQVIPMLPRLLCEELCSLNPLSDRLTFSVIWKITPGGKVELLNTRRDLFLVCVLYPASPAPLLDTERVVWPLSHPLLCEVELRSRSEHDRGPRETVFSRRTSASGPRTPHRWDPSGRTQPALYCQEPTSSAFHRRGTQTRPGLLTFKSLLRIHQYIICWKIITWIFICIYFLCLSLFL